MTTGSVTPAPGGASERLLVVLLGGIVAMTPLAVASYLPAFPEMSREFGVGPGAVQMTLTVYLLGLTLAQLFYGPLADRFGRKPPLYFGITLYVAASAGCALTSSIELFLVMRFFQALGGAAGMVMALAAVRDLYEHKAMARMLSRMTLVSGAGPIVGPLIGGIVMAVAGWRSIFWVLAAIGVALLAGIHYGLRESLRPEFVRRASVGAALRTYFDVLRDRSYIGFALTNWLSMGAMFGYITASSFALINVFGLSPQVFSVVYGINAFGMIFMSQINARLLKSHSLVRVLKTALITRATVAVAITLVDLSGLLALPWYLPMLFVVAAAFGLISPNSTAGALTEQKARAGSASAMLGSTQYAMAAAAGVLISLLNDGSALAMNAVVAMLTLGALLSYLVLVERAPPRAGAAQ